MTTINEEIGVFTLFWSQVPRNIPITIDVHNYGESTIIREANFRYYRLHATIPEDIPQAFLKKGMVLELDISQKALGDEIKRLLYFKGLLNTPVRITFKRVGRKTASLLSVKQLDTSTPSSVYFNDEKPLDNE